MDLPRRKPHRSPLNRFYFALPLPTGRQSDQFFYFTGLVRQGGGRGQEWDAQVKGGGGCG